MATCLTSADAQAQAFEAFIEQDDYLSENRGEIAERFGLLNPWYSNLDLKIVHTFGFNTGSSRQRLQLNLDILNVTNLLNSDWGVRQVASPAATSPLTLVGTDANGRNQYNFSGAETTFIDDPGLFSRWQVQIGVKYLFN